MLPLRARNNSVRRFARESMDPDGGVIPGLVRVRAPQARITFNGANFLPNTFSGRIFSQFCNTAA